MSFFGLVWLTIDGFHWLDGVYLFHVPGPSMQGTFRVCFCPRLRHLMAHGRELGHVHNWDWLLKGEALPWKTMSILNLVVPSLPFCFLWCLVVFGCF